VLLWARWRNKAPYLPLGYVIVNKNFRFSMQESPATIEQADVLDEILDDTGVCLVVHNDEVNTFDWVIESLVKICRHTMEQAEQCAYIIHYSGKYAVKHGVERELNTMRRGLVDRGINATLE
jgi:ATP-dependent Clp protease adaptor protein ClpS